MRKHGILPPRPPTPPSPSPPASPQLRDLLEAASPSKLNELSADAADSDTERFIESYRRKRLNEMRAEQKRWRFGQVLPIGRDDYKREVTEASKVSEPDDESQSGTGVVCLLYKDANAASDRLRPHIRELAARHPRVKFVSIVGDKCIPNYPDQHLPTIFVYRNGELTGQEVAWGAKAAKTKDDLENFLHVSLAMPSESDPRPKSRGSDSSSSERDLGAPGSRNFVGRNRRRSRSHDSDD